MNVGPVKFPATSDGKLDWGTVLGFAVIALGVVIAVKHANKIPVVGSALAKIV
jgi:hypothetical protein